jgi:hypothetical protein
MLASTAGNGINLFRPNFTPVQQKEGESESDKD